MNTTFPSATNFLAAFAICVGVGAALGALGLKAYQANAASKKQTKAE